MYPIRTGKSFWPQWTRLLHPNPGLPDAIYGQKHDVWWIDEWDDPIERQFWERAGAEPQATQAEKGLPPIRPITLGPRYLREGTHHAGD